MKFIISIFTLFLCHFFIYSIGYAETSNLHQRTTTPPDARFDIVQSELAAKWTFRLDTYTGKVFQLVSTTSGGNTWEEMLIQDLPKINDANKQRFILFTSGLAARHTFLMDGKTGKTWVVTESKIEISPDETSTINVWQPFE